MAGTVDLVQRCYSGVEARDDVLWLDPALPDELHTLRSQVHYRGHRVELVIARDRLEVAVLPALAPPIRVGFDGEVVELGSGALKEWSLPPMRPRPPRHRRDHGHGMLGTWATRLGGVAEEWRARK